MKYMLKSLIGVCCLLVTIFTFSCRHPQHKGSEKNDTTAIILAALNSKSFLKDHLTAKSDTLFMLKTKDYNNTWPQQSAYFKILYIPDSPDAKSVNRPKDKLDPRARIDIAKLQISADTALIAVHDYGFQLDYLFNLKKDHDNWKIVKEQTLIY